jgi:hypothetical protein
LPGAALAAEWIGRQGAARSSVPPRPPPPGAVAADLLPCFVEMVRGSLAPGFGAHFGLGLLVREAGLAVPRRAGGIVAMSERVGRGPEK